MADGFLPDEMAAVQRRIEQNSHPEPNSGCWLWDGCVDWDGYGLIHVPRDQATRRARRCLGAHRMSYMAHRGPIPQGLHVCHRCDTPGCVNPGHLFLGTNADNMSDSKRKGRRATGSKHGSRTKPESTMRGEGHCDAQITEAQARMVLTSARSPGWIIRTAREFGVSPQILYRVVARKTWRHLEVEQ